ncbi:CCAAT/enhancer-binding protein gamma isoform X2 [Leuresthes tenuis]|uniref:CCAAT/enhancer-binding protein gamma isoform X2 n=1 Tax=Leuresthes tenuis TaxID=355514 RepID=UPI003B5086EE
MFELHISLFVSSWCTTFRLLCSWLPEAWSRTCTCACTCACTSLICLNPPHHQRGGSDSCWRPASDQFEPGDIKRLSVQKRGGEKLHPHLHLSEVERSSTLASTFQRWREAPPSPPPVRGGEKLHPRLHLSEFRGGEKLHPRLHLSEFRGGEKLHPHLHLSEFRGGEKLHPRLHLSEVERSSTLASTCQPRPDRCLCGEFWADPDFSGQL